MWMAPQWDREPIGQKAIKFKLVLKRENETEWFSMGNIYIPKMAYLLTKAKQNRFEIEKKMLKESPIATAKIFVFLK